MERSRGPGGTSEAKVGPRQRWAILIGVGKYEDHLAIANLRYAVADGKSLYEALTSRGGFPKENVVAMWDDTNDPRHLPTRSNIIAQLAASLQLPKKGDTVLIYFAGHGIEANGTSYLLPSDARMANLRFVPPAWSRRPRGASGGRRDEPAAMALAAERQKMTTRPLRTRLLMLKEYVPIIYVMSQ